MGINGLSRQQQLYDDKADAFINFMYDLNGPTFESDKIVMNRNLFGLVNTMGLSMAREKKKKMDAGEAGDGDKKKKKKKKKKGAGGRGGGEKKKKKKKKKKS